MVNNVRILIIEKDFNEKTEKVRHTHEQTNISAAESGFTKLKIKIR